MKTSLILLACELAERRILWWIFLLGFVPLALPLLGAVAAAEEPRP